jgi:hypothetical protein
MAKSPKGSTDNPLRWSNKMDAVFNKEVAVPVLNGHLSIPNQGIYFNYPFDVIRTNVIESGLADFDKPYSDEELGTLTTDQIALCYSFANLKKHFFSALAVILQHKAWLTSQIDASTTVVLIDVGCGPGTAGLAFGEVCKDAFTYYGIDRSRSMRNKARSMMREGKDIGLIDKNTLVKCKSSWDDVPTDFGGNATVLLIFSYFFASPFLTSADCKSIAKFYRKLRGAKGTLAVNTLYTNSTFDVANANYDRYLKELGVDPAESPPKKKTVHYFMSAHNQKLGSETFLQEIYGTIQP